MQKEQLKKVKAQSNPLESQKSLKSHSFKTKPDYKSLSDFNDKPFIMPIECNSSQVIKQNYIKDYEDKPQEQAKVDYSKIFKFFNIPCEEKIIQIERALCYDGFTDKPGLVGFTNYRIFFYYSEDRLNNSKTRLRNKYPLLFVGKITKSNDKYSNRISMEVTLKDTRVFKYFFLTGNGSGFYSELIKLAYPSSELETYAFKYKQSKNDSIDGWDVYNQNGEFRRQGMYNFQESKPGTADRDDEVFGAKVRMCSVNLDFDICKSYPNMFFIPETVQDEEAKECAAFRLNNRLPVLTWLNRDKQSSLWRSSQFKSGTVRSKQDENFIKELSLLSGCKSQVLYVFDTRSHKKNKGSETTEGYSPHVEVNFCHIPNYNKIRHSYLKMQDIDKHIESKKLLGYLDSAGWLDTISTVLKFSVDIMSLLKVDF